MVVRTKKVSDPISTTIEKLKAQQAKLAARIQLMTARAKVSERKQDTRRKILIGAYYLDQAKTNNETEKLFSLMHNYLTRDSDRELFNLTPLQKTNSST
jgi:large subunit ribosomal protein L7/L12